MEEVRFLSPVTAKGVKMILEYFTNNWMEKMSEAYTVKNEMYMTWFEIDIFKQMSVSNPDVCVSASLGRRTPAGLDAP